MAISKYTIVSYDGIDLGAVYLEDIGKRSQLGGGEQFEIGQDIVINSGDSIALVNSGDVLLSWHYVPFYAHFFPAQTTLLQLQRNKCSG